MLSIDKDLLKAAQQTVSKEIARLKRLEKDLSSGGRKYDWLYEMCDGDESSILLNQWAVSECLEAHQQNYNSIVRYLAEQMQNKRDRRHYLKISEPKPRTLQQRLEDKRYKRQYIKFPDDDGLITLEDGPDEPVPEFNFDL